MNWINKHLEKIALASVIFAALWIVLGPLLLTQFSLVNFTSCKNNTGLIGDTIGGITAPVIGLISIVLLYLALIKQIESNQITVYEANFRIIYDEIGQVKNGVERFSYGKAIGINAIGILAAEYGVKNNIGELTDADYNVLDSLDILLNKFQKIFYLLDNLKTSDEYKDILAKDLQNVFSVYFSTVYGIMQEKWGVTADDINRDWTKGKMYAVKDHLRVIREDILRRNPPRI